MCKYPKALTNLNVNRARVAVLDREISKLRNLAEKLQKDTYLETSRLGDPTAHIHSEGGHADTTARQGVREDIHNDVKQLLNDICALTIERHRTATWIEIAESALAFLPDRERQIVELRAVEGLSWFDVVDALYDRTGDLIGERTARRTYERACNKIAPFFQCDTNGSREYHRSAATA